MNPSLRLSACVVDLEARTVSAAGEVHALRPREVELLLYLAARAGRVVARDELLRAVWGVKSRSSRALDMCVSRLRELIERDPAEPDHLCTVRGVGYRFDLPLPAPVRVAYHLPARLDGFVGRQADLAALAMARGDGADARLVTVTGPPGVGKTRLALEHGAQVLAGHPGGVWFCELADADSVAAICAAVGRALGAELQGDPSGPGPAAQLGEILAHRGRALLVLDNLEQALAPARTLIERWLGRAPELRVLATSREPTRLPGELEIEVAPLEPDAAAELFVRRAGPRAGLDGADPRVAAVVDRVERLPLAIELAAARLRGLSLDALEERLQDGLAALESSSLRPGRHGSVTAALQWSWALLSRAEQEALVQLTVFRGGFDAASAARVVALDDGAPAVDLVVEALADRHLVTRSDRAEAGGVRFGMLELARRFAADPARAPVGGPAAIGPAEERHGRWFARLGRLDRIDAVQSYGAPAWTVLGEQPNLEAAFARAIGRADPAVATGCAIALELVGQRTDAMADALEGLGDALRPLDRATLALWRSRRVPGQEAVVLLHGARQAWQAAGETALVNRALLHIALAHQRSGQAALARVALEEGLAEARSHDFALAAARFQYRLIGQSLQDRSLADAEQVAREALAAAQALGATRLEQWARTEYAQMLLFDRRIDEALAEVQRVAAADDVDVPSSLEQLGAVLRCAGRPLEGLAHHLRALALEHAQGLTADTMFTERSIGVTLLDLGDLPGAIAHLDAATAVARAHGDALLEASAAGFCAVAHALSAVPGPCAAREAAEATLDAAFAVLGDDGPALDRASLTTSAGAVALALGDPALAAERLWESVALHRETSASWNAAVPLTELGLLDLAAGRVDQGTERLRDCVEMLEPFGVRVPTLALSLAGAGLGAVLSGERVTGEAQLDRGILLARALGARPALARALGLRAEAAWCVDDVREVETALDEADALAPPAYRTPLAALRARPAR